MVSHRYTCMFGTDVDAVIMALWRGELVQQNNEQHDIDCKASLRPDHPASNVLCVARRAI